MRLLLFRSFMYWYLKDSFWHYAIVGVNTNEKLFLSVSPYPSLNVIYRYNFLKITSRCACVIVWGEGGFWEGLTAYTVATDYIRYIKNEYGDEHYVLSSIPLMVI